MSYSSLTLALNTLTLSHSHTLTLSHSHTLTLSHSHTLTLSHSHTLTLSHSHTLTLSHSHTLTLSHSHTLTLSHSHTHSHTLTLSHSHTLTILHSYTLTLSHTHTHPESVHVTVRARGVWRDLSQVNKTSARGDGSLVVGCVESQPGSFMSDSPQPDSSPSSMGSCCRSARADHTSTFTVVPRRD